jgi:glutamine cyclotransferase
LGLRITWDPARFLAFVLPALALDSRDVTMSRAIVFAAMSKAKQQQKSPTTAASTPSGTARKPRPPAWRSRLGLIIAFFTLTIGGAYLVVNFDAIARLLSPHSGIPTYGYKVAARYKHASDAFTQGLVYHQGFLYESTGLEGQSSLRKCDLSNENWTIEKLDPKWFGEGLALWRDKLIQLTYRAGLAHVYDLNLKLLDQKLEYEGEGWGLTHDGSMLIMSNGTSDLQFRNAETFELDRRLTVTVNGRRLGRLNELEYANGKIYANVWHEDYVVEIDPRSGQVTARIDLRGLLSPQDRPPNSEAVLNGIAFNSSTNRFIVTGKYWPYLFEIELVPPAGN